jgi:hypothetical protein
MERLAARFNYLAIYGFPKRESTRIWRFHQGLRLVSEGA